MRKMKTIFIALSLTGMAMVSCQDELAEMTPQRPGYMVSMESFQAQTKTQLGEENSVVWSEDDIIMVYENKDLGKAYQLESSCAGNSSGEFSLVEGWEVEGDGTSFSGTLAVYPYSERLSVEVLEGGKYAISGICFPSEQRYAEHTFSNGAFPMVSISSAGGSELNFKNVGGVLKLNLTGDYAVSKITLTGNSGERVSGEGTVTIGNDGLPYVSVGENSSESVTMLCDPVVQLDPYEATEFYISLPPTEFKNGFKVVITDSDGFKAVKETDLRNVVYRSKILRMPEVSPELSDPICETGDACDITKTSVSISCSFANIPQGAECGIKLAWDDGEMDVPVDDAEGTRMISVSGLSPDTVYSYWTYICYDDFYLEGQVLQFETEPMQLTGIWTYVETSSKGSQNVFTMNLLEDGSVVLNKSNEYDSAEWTISGNEITVKFFWSNSHSYRSLTMKAVIDEIGICASGKATYRDGSYNTGYVSVQDCEIEMTRNMDRCRTGEVLSLTEVSAVLGCTFVNVSDGTVGGVVVSDGKNETKYPALASAGDQEIQISGLAPGTAYSYWAYCECDGRYIMGEVKEFTTVPMNVTGVWTCVETYSNGSKSTYSVALYEDGSAELMNDNNYEYNGWSCKGDELSVSFSNYRNSSGSGIILKVRIDLDSTPMYGTGKIETWVENWNTGASSGSLRDLTMTKNEDVCSTGDAVNITVASAVINCSYSDLPSYAECGVVVSGNNQTFTFYADGAEGKQPISAAGLDPGIIYKYWAFAEFDGKYIRGESKEFTTASMDLLGTWLCVETDSKKTESYTVQLHEDGKATISKRNFSYQSAGWSCIGRKLNIGITISVPPAGISGGTYITDGIIVEIEDPYNPVHGVGEAHREVINLDTLGGSNYYRDIEMTKQSQ